MSNNLPNFFEIFNLPHQFYISGPDLYNRYIELQQKYHPDKLPKQDPVAYKQAIEQTMLINKAYNILKDEVKRAAYMLNLKNIDVESEKSKYKPGHDILVLAMDLAEEIDNADESQLTNIRERIEDIYNKACKDFAQNIASKNLDQSIKNWFILRYMQKNLEDIKLKL